MVVDGSWRSRAQAKRGFLVLTAGLRPQVSIVEGAFAKRGG